MGLPIYQSEGHQDAPEKSLSNKGLWFDRFFDHYQLQKPDIKPDEGAKIKFMGDFAGVCGDEEQLKNCVLRQAELAEAVGGDYRIYQLDGHFVSGMGNSHPVENGFLWHYTLGTPYFAGSQVKGLVRSLIEQYYQRTDKEGVLFEWFGSDNKNPREAARDNKAGNLVFFDAIPFSRPVLSVDIMTPHMGNWYAEGGQIQDVKKDSDKIPADWHDPVPVPFLAARSGSFLFSIGKRPGVDIDIEQVFGLLDKALTYMGAGAKTQTGYGYMTYNKKETEKLKRIVDEKKKNAKASAELASAKANVSELHGELMDCIYQNDWRDSSDMAKNRFSESIHSWLEKMEAAQGDKECAALFLEIAKLHYPRQISDPDGKKVKPAQREWILRLFKLVGS